jgi:hypothetical protein
MGLEEAVIVKLTSQAEFVIWWDGPDNQKNKGGRPSETRRATATGLIAAKDGIPSRDILKRWRKLI